MQAGIEPAGMCRGGTVVGAADIMGVIDWVPWVAMPMGSMTTSSITTGAPVVIEF